MSQSCEYIDGCPMFKYFRAIAKKIYMELYCEGDFETCQRRQLRIAGKPVPGSLLPYGGHLWKEGDRPPEYWEV